MPGFFDDLAVPIPCERCGKKSRQEPSLIQLDSNFTCPFCGGVNEIDPAQFREQLGRLEKSLDDFGKAVMKIARIR